MPNNHSRVKQTKLYIPPKEMKLPMELYRSISSRDMHLPSKELNLNYAHEIILNIAWQII
jgi:hypothetical protein